MTQHKDFTIERVKHINYFPEYTPLKSSKGELVVYCSLCDKKAIIFDFNEKNGLVRIMSAQRMYVVSFNDIKKLKEKLKKGEYRYFHDFLRKDWEGLDYYCPECDRVYCINHYQITPYFDSPEFYDYSTGKCPLGHERIVDD